MPAGKQMVASFIGLFVASAMTFCPAMKQAGDSPCVGKHHTTRLIRGIRMLFILKHSRTIYSHCSSYDGRQHSYFASTNRFYYSANICLFYI